MNRFRARRKGKEETVETEQTTMPSFKGFLRGKKTQEEEPKKTVDISTALPSHDEFRTSLLMTGLSARFSMLREQDDPNTKIGKASDDSVLYPKRQSRLMDYGFSGGLNDIAEVESIRAPFTRVESFASADDANSTKGSIMSRGKPTDGNNLFGGRQKILVGGRTLYEGDVATSAFQKWRREERERERAMLQDDYEKESDEASPDLRSRASEEESFATRSESPVFVGYNRRRETSSTTSSSLARNSTAATSVVSQQAGSIKDWQSQYAGSTSAGSTPAMDRSVTRTRRLYEQALSQDLHDHQSTALSRIDTLSGKRSFTSSRSPDPSNSATSPTSVFSFGDRRTIMSKASAPNLRSASPTTMDSGLKVGTLAETRINFVGTPPLSPPISETGDLPILAIQPNDHGKATAMGVFQKPVQPYDESKYAQRQLQLQQGRETPTQGIRPEMSDNSLSRSSSSEGQQRARGTDLQPSLPTPQSFMSQASDRSPVSEQPDLPPSLYPQESPADSPTLAPPSMLGGLVRQHMRSESSTSSIYPAPQSAEIDSPFTSDARDSAVLGALGDVKGNTWQDQPWNPFADDGDQNRVNRDTLDPRTEQLDRRAQPERSPDMTDKQDDSDFANQLANARRRVQERLTSYVESDNSRSTSPHPPSEPSKEPNAQIKPAPLGLLRGKSSRGSLVDRNRDASQAKAMKMLGIGASTMSTSPSPAKQSFDDVGLPSMKEEEPEPEFKPQPEPEASEARQVDRDEDRDADTRSTRSSEKEDENVPPGLRAFRMARRELQKRRELETLSKHPTSEQAMKDVGPTTGAHRSPEREHGSAPRGGSRDRQPPPRAYYQRRDPSEDSYRSGPSRPASRTDRDRSGSETSSGRAPSRPPRLRNNSSPYDNMQVPPGGNNVGMSRQPLLRSPGLPGTDIRRSPIMPPHPYPGSAPSPNRFERSASSGNLRVQNRGPLDPLPQQSSPNFPNVMGLPTSPRLGVNMQAEATSPRLPVTHAPRRPSAPPAPAAPSLANGGNPSTNTSTLNDSMKKLVNKKDISDPTFVMSTSRVPTMSLPQRSTSPDAGNSGQRSRSTSRARSGSNGAEYNPPPLPPINPRRTRYMGRRNEEAEEEHVGPSISPRFPATNGYLGPSKVADDNRSAFSVSDDEEKPSSRWRLRKQASEADGLNSKPHAATSPFIGSPFAPARDARAFAAAGPPASRSVMTPTVRPSASSRGVPGGMI